MGATQSEKPKRPYWHVDAKWICAIILMISMAITLPVVSLYQLTNKEPATRLISYALAGMTSPDGIDSDNGLTEVKQEVILKGSKTVTISGISVIFTANDVNTLSPRELRLKVFGAFSSKFYEKGAKGFAESQGQDKPTAEKFEKDSSAFGLFTAASHDIVGKVLIGLMSFDLLVITGLLYFGRRFGKIVSIGFVFLLVGLPGIVFGALASQNSSVNGAARASTESSSFDMIGNFISFISPLVLPYLAYTYLLVLILGFSLLVVSGIGRIIYAVVQHHRNRKKINDTTKPVTTDLKETDKLDTI